MYANIHRFSFWLTWSTLSLIDAAWCLLMLFDAEWSWFMLFDYDWCWSTWLMLIDADSDHAADAVTPAVAPGVTHFGAYHRPSSGNFSDYYDIKRFLCICFCNVLPHRQFRCMQIYAWCKSAYLHKICLKMPPDPTHPLPSRSERRLPDRRPTYNGLLPPVPNIDVIITAFLISAANPDTWSLSLLARTMSVKVIMW